MRNYLKRFTGKITYTQPKVNEIDLELQEAEDLTDEIEKSLLEIKKVWNIPSEEINEAIASRKLLRKNVKR